MASETGSRLKRGSTGGWRACGTTFLTGNPFPVVPPPTRTTKPDSMIPLPEALARLGRSTPLPPTGMRDAFTPITAHRSTTAMTELARQIIRQQWPLRNHPETLQRARARSLIRAHVLLLRKWDELPAIPR
jgi:hypothetical protein